MRLFNEFMSPKLTNVHTISEFIYNLLYNLENRYNRSFVKHIAKITHPRIFQNNANTRIFSISNQYFEISVEKDIFNSTSDDIFAQDTFDIIIASRTPFNIDTLSQYFIKKIEVSSSVLRYTFNGVIIDDFSRKPNDGKFYIKIKYRIQKNKVQENLTIGSLTALDSYKEIIEKYPVDVKKNAEIYRKNAAFTFKIRTEDIIPPNKNSNFYTNIVYVIKYEGVVQQLDGKDGESIHQLIHFDASTKKGWDIAFKEILNALDEYDNDIVKAGGMIIKTDKERYDNRGRIHAIKYDV